ncbi:aminotransferase class V-fold PLP-dependent enzyme [Biformimicrobium ophioploci]|uniref:cysteine desulfurase n=1 Tax=Biformimicrobium ophioploci TaxID=3036711 RepID=A0ABQ6M2A3_9GAMM|nr:aminotransferase class V-fold PLP-dependent enzyme [Microbulbifer sp. NKW57]GMG88479.1 hypothetical protein MNKW57_28000 [Microbulbifer sp. NKW57]
MFDATVFKEQFPLFKQPENRALVYLDNAATTQKPAVVIDAVADFYRTSNANAHRSSHRLARAATAVIEGARARARNFLGTSSAREIVFCRGATEALNLLASSLCQSLQAGDEIVLTAVEHHANLVPWQMMAARYGLVLRFVPGALGIPDFSCIDEVISDRTRVVSVTGASNALGLRSDLAAVRNAISGKEIVFVVDGAQLAAHDDIDVQALGCDFLACSAHKFYGPSGIGLLYGKLERLETLPPWQGGGEMIRSAGLYDADYAGPPHRFEPGTSSLAAIAGLGVAFTFLAQVDRQAMREHEQKLVEQMHKGLGQIEGVRLLTVPQNNLGIATFTPAGDWSAADLCLWLDQRDIAVRAGHHCAQPLHTLASVQTSVRASVAGYNSAQDIERFVAAVAEFVAEQEAAIPPNRAGTTIADSAIAVGPEDSIEELSVETLERARGWQARYRELMQWSKAISPKPWLRTPENLVRGCESDAWLQVSEAPDGKQVYVDSDSRVVKGLAALLLVLMRDYRQEPEMREKILQRFTDLGFERHLSESRSNGFRALLERALG